MLLLEVENDKRWLYRAKKKMSQEIKHVNLRGKVLYSEGLRWKLSTCQNSAYESKLGGGGGTRLLPNGCLMAWGAFELPLGNQNFKQGAWMGAQNTNTKIPCSFYNFEM